MTAVTDGRRHHLTDKKHKVSQKLKFNKIKQLTYKQASVAPSWRTRCAIQPSTAP
ncbi:hypothetical protein ACK32A_18370 [Aeromonas enteropelogenes]|uniref:hypothetical protein n=1 Tax=Aeromonas TaxID=642 RepID=UPI0022860017|nr:hypothetical protein [Aeromonas enteropelogenes]MCZ0753366.1 hypothetical protein [Aeromonas enteropelogenes]